MDHSIHEQGSQNQQDSRSLTVGLPILSELIEWLADLTRLTEEEQEDAGICIGCVWDE